MAKSYPFHYWRFPRGQQRMNPKLSQSAGNKCSQMDTVLNSICKIVILHKIKSVHIYYQWTMSFIQSGKTSGFETGLCWLWFRCSALFESESAKFHSFLSNVFPLILGGKDALNRGSSLRRFNANFPPDIKGKTLRSLRQTGERPNQSQQSLISRSDAPTLWSWHFSKCSPCLW